MGEDAKDMDDVQGTAKQIDPFLLDTWPPRAAMRWRLSSTLDDIKRELRVVLGRVEAADYAGNEEDVQIVTDLVDQIRDALSDYQVCLDPKQFP